ncbi:RNA-binding protein [Streptomyces sp. ID05-26A]|nr:RNA-binding protein [Streptomyces sp. ID05-26A]
MFKYVHRVTKHDVTRGEPRPEAGYLAAVAAFADESGVVALTIRDPEICMPWTYADEPDVEGFGLAGLFPPGLTGYYDGARVSIADACGLVVAMVRDNGAWCRLEDDDFFVHVSTEWTMYVGTAGPCPDAVSRARASGLRVEPVDSSPLDPARQPVRVAHAADEAFWAEVTRLAADRGTVILEERYVSNASRWHRLRAGDVESVPRRLTPRAALAVWPELNENVPAELPAVHDHEFGATVVWEDRDGAITHVPFANYEYPVVAARLSQACAAMVCGEPLLEAVLPDDDGVVRVRWSV